ncbi:MAG: DUF4833 domain-containing protein [Saprospiraceae bacterium]|nr:DUF4833 domain-containing protein [Bacteroidia bacterium]NNE14280.1 DUF4833 domain-containing protein [Saprospiraceae bacterium]NNL92965.1 DUF4833 domain-containing protein [Saprospiraceae bacterium]
MFKKLDKSQFKVIGEKGLPEHYPIPKNIAGLLFYIQRNLNKNTVVYAINKDANGYLNETFPMKVFWIKYDNGAVIAELNKLQTKAFGYSSKKINNTTFEFVMDSHKQLRFFIAQNEQNEFNIITKINSKDALLSNIYVYANEFGLFPKVEYIELYGNHIDSDLPSYEKILI